MSDVHLPPWLFTGLALFGLNALACNGELPTQDGGAVSEPAASGLPGGSDLGVASPPEGGGGAGSLAGGDGPSLDTCDQILPQPRLRRLSPAQYDRTVKTFVSGPEDRPSSGFAPSFTQNGRFVTATSDLSMSTPHVGQLLKVGEGLSALLVEAPESLEPCMAAVNPAATCVDDFINVLLARAFRRPAGEEAAIYLEFYQSQVPSFGHEGALSLTVQRALVSPNFLFRTELGDAEGNLTGYELASAVSYLISDGPPDEQLFGAATAGDLADPELLKSHATRLLASRETATGVETFFRENLGYGQVPGLDKDETLFPDYSVATGLAMARETEEFIAHVLWEDDGKLSTLMTAPYSMVNQELAGLYGLDGLGPNFEQVTLPAEQQRAGLLTQPSLLALHSSNEESSIVDRGLSILEDLLCKEPPPPPESVADAEVVIEEGLNQRQALAQHNTDPACATCHSLFDPFAYPLEYFDAIGAYRDSAGGVPVDPVAELPWIGGMVVSSPVELAQALSDSDALSECLTERLHEFSFGGTDPNAACHVANLTEAFVASGGDVRSAVVTLIESEEFRKRAAPGAEL